MDDNDAPLKQTLEKWRMLPAGDRKAIQKSLSAEQRLLLEEAIAAYSDGEENTEAKEFHGYSPWLVGILKSTSRNEDGGTANKEAAELTPKASAALRDLHESFLNNPDCEQKPSGFFEWARQAVHDLGGLR